MSDDSSVEEVSVVTSSDFSSDVSACSTPPQQIASKTVSRDIDPFILKLYNLLEETDGSFMHWIDEGTGFVVNDIPVFELIVLPKYKISKISTFIRKIRRYKFRTKNILDGIIKFTNINFQRDRPALLYQIKTKVVMNMIEQKKKTRAEQEIIKLREENKKLKEKVQQMENAYVDYS